MTVKTSISLTDEMASWAKAQVAQGVQTSLSGVVHEAFRALQEKQRIEAQHRAEEQAFFAMLTRRAEGPHVPAGEFASRVEAMLAEKLRSNGVED